jgi:hypothetical protein
MRDGIVLLVGALLGGVVVKALIDPALDRRRRQQERHERWIEDALEHAEAVLTLMSEARSAAIGQGGLFDTDALGRAVLHALSPASGPEALLAAAEHDKSGELREAAVAAEEAWRVVRVATMDDQHRAPAMTEEYEPLFAVDRYETALRTFVSIARRKL